MGCGAKCLKVILIIVNVIFFLAGAAVLGAGLWVRFDPNLEKFSGLGTEFEEIKDALNLAAYILIAFGAFTFVVGFCGCCGAMRESKCLLGTYILLVLIVLGAEIGGGVYGYINKDELLTEFDKVATTYLTTKYGRKGNGDGDEAWNVVMQAFKCCGVHGAADFKNYNSTPGASVPDSCCVLNKEETKVVNTFECQKEAKNGVKTKTASLYGVGCLDEVKRLINQNMTLLIGVGAGVAGFELLVVIMAIGFCCSMKDDD